MRKRNLFSFRLRTLLLITALIAIVFGLAVQRSSRMRGAHIALRNKHASLRFECLVESPDVNPLDANAILFALFYYPKSIRVFSNYEDKDLSEVLKVAADWRTIRELKISAEFDDRDAMQLAKISSLRRIAIHSSSITEYGALHLLSSPSLRSIDFQGCRNINSKKLHLLPIAPGIEEVNFHNTGVDREAIEALVRNNPHCKIESEFAPWRR